MSDTDLPSPLTSPGAMTQRRDALGREAEEAYAAMLAAFTAAALALYRSGSPRAGEVLAAWDVAREQMLERLAARVRAGRMTEMERHALALSLMEGTAPEVNEQPGRVIGTFASLDAMDLTGTLSADDRDALAALALSPDTGTLTPANAAPTSSDRLREALPWATAAGAALLLLHHRRSQRKEAEAARAALFSGPSWDTLRAGAAQTMATRAHGLEMIERGRDAAGAGGGVAPIRKRWVTRHDSHVRTSHRAMEGVTVGLEDRFIVGPSRSPMQYPADPAGPPSEVYNCRCVLVLVDPYAGRS